MTENQKELDEINDMFQREVQLKLETFALAHQMPHLKEPGTVYARMFPMVRNSVDMLQALLVCRVYSAGKRSHTISFQVPETWWDAFKVEVLNKRTDFAPVRWFLRKFPPKSKALSETVDAHALFPDLPVDNNESRIRFMWSNRPDKGVGCAPLE